ncbi:MULTISPECIES: GntR family transcriptional regulator [unclassified Sporosarcina]|uniref:GntR family transcriptional regulator n=1 Tax=unclassified Sporosarcina TaxID=2647733 RepID=UPI000C16FB7A|nr:MULTISPECIES: GntR family transcriptional regulator [unclassified Sporosarcina]
MKLDPNSPLPLHVSLKDIIKNSIEQGFYEKKIPSERELTEQHEVSRATVREAVAQLVREGILEKRHGRVLQMMARYM